MSKDKLTIKQEAFCQAYVRLGKSFLAYVEVFICAKFSEEKIKKLASDLLKNKLVKKRISEIKNESKSKPSGRPTLYKEEYGLQVFKLCLLGATDKEIAEFFEVCEATVNNWKLEHPIFLESIREGKKKADIEVAAALFNTTQDRTVKEQQAFKTKKVYWDESGKRCEEEEIQIVEVDKAIPADFRSQQFWLKNRKSDSWRDKTEVESVNTHSFDLSSLSEDEIKNLFEISLKLKPNNDA